MSTLSQPEVTQVSNDTNWAIYVKSIGQSGASLVKALKQVSPLSEQRIASLLYQAPTKLFTDLPHAAAQNIHQILENAGLECEVVDTQADLQTGDDSYEIALVFKDVSRMTEVAQLIMTLIGADIQTVRQILFTSPTVLLGKISLNTARTIQKRFTDIGVDVDISQPSLALFDVFVGSCSELELYQIKKIFTDLALPLVNEQELQNNTLLSAGLSRDQADKIWAKICRTNLPVRIVNRDFERFDLELQSLPPSEEANRYLTETIGMPASILEKVYQRLPLMLRQNISFPELETNLAEITALGGTAIGNLLVFQTFSLQLEKVENVSSTIDILHALSGLAVDTLKTALETNKIIEGPFSSLQARWLQHELKKVGSSSKRILR